MEVYHQQQDTRLLGKQLPEFPNGIQAAFTQMMETLPEGKARNYYGLSKMDDEGKILYWTAAEEKKPGEAEQYGYEQMLITAGSYLSSRIEDWHNNLDCIKDVFHELMLDERADLNELCIEWYPSDTEMFCLLKMKS